MAGGLIKAAPYPDIQVSKKNYICFKYSIAFPVKSFLKETKIQEKKYLYTTYTAFKIIRSNATKDRRYFYLILLPTKPQISKKNQLQK